MANQVFIAFASEDKAQRDLLKGQAKNANSEFDYVDMSVKEPYDSAWKTKTKERIKRSHGIIALLSRNSENADGEKWEVECAIDLGKPLLGIYAYDSDRSVPSYFPRGKVRDWTHDNLKKFLDSL